MPLREQRVLSYLSCPPVVDLPLVFNSSSRYLAVGSLLVITAAPLWHCPPKISTYFLVFTGHNSETADWGNAVQQPPCSWTDAHCVWSRSKLGHLQVELYYWIGWCQIHSAICAFTAFKLFVHIFHTLKSHVLQRAWHNKSRSVRSCLGGIVKQLELRASHGVKVIKPTWLKVPF